MGIPCHSVSGSPDGRGKSFSAEVTVAGSLVLVGCRVDTRDGSGVLVMAGVLVAPGDNVAVGVALRPVQEANMTASVAHINKTLYAFMLISLSQP